MQHVKLGNTDLEVSRIAFGCWAIIGGEAAAEEETFRVIAQVRELADETGESMADLSLAWLLAQPGVTCVIVGGRNANQTHLYWTPLIESEVQP